MGIDFKPLAPQENKALAEALRGNSTDGRPLHMDPLTTGWRPGADEGFSDDEVINAIRSVPCHYALNIDELESDLEKILEKHSLPQMIVFFRDGTRLCQRVLATNPIDAAIAKTAANVNTAS